MESFIYAKRKSAARSADFLFIGDFEKSLISLLPYLYMTLYNLFMFRFANIEHRKAALLWLK